MLLTGEDTDAFRLLPLREVRCLCVDCNTWGDGTAVEVVHPDTGFALVRYHTLPPLHPFDFRSTPPGVKP